MPSFEIISFSPYDKKLIKQFAQFEIALYKKDKYYVAPMQLSLVGNPILGAKGLLTKEHSFHKNASVQYFIALDKKQIVGRIAICINNNYNKYHNTNIGSFGFFEVINDYDIAKILLDKGLEWLKSKNIYEIMGPLNFSSNETLGLLISGFDNMPYLNTPYNKKYYSAFLEKYGFTKAKDLIAQVLPVKKNEKTMQRHKRLDKIVTRIKERNNIITRPIDFGKNFKNDIKLMRTLYIDAWKNNWGFVPITKEEMLTTAADMKIIGDKELIRFAYIGDKAVGFIGVLPDLNEIVGTGKNFFDTIDYVRIIKILLKRNKVKRVRLLLFGILEQYQKIGVDSVLYYDCFKYAHEHKDYEECELSWLLEDNELIIRAGKSMNATHYKTWRIYSLNFS